MNWDITHGDSKVGKRAKEYAAWCNIKSRCYNKNSINYKDYGGRGIKMCKRWLNSYSTFLSDMGRSPSPEYSIDRINNNGNYKPSNCCWATSKDQIRNSRVSKINKFIAQYIKQRISPQYIIANELKGVASYGIVKDIKHGVSWKDI